MTAFAVVQAFSAADENLSRLAFRTAYFTRVNPKHLPRSEDGLFAKAKAKKAKRQSIQDQFATARLMTMVMSKEVH